MGKYALLESELRVAEYGTIGTDKMKTQLWFLLINMIKSPWAGGVLCQEGTSPLLGFLK